MRKRAVAIINPVSGRCDMRPALRRVRRTLATHGCTLDILVTDGVGHAVELARQCADEADAVLAVGGDGTINEVINGLMGRHTPVVVWATGTANLVAHELGMPREPRDVAHAILYGEPFSFDIGVLNDRRFLAVAGVGFDAECVARMCAVRKGHITHLDYFWPIWRTFWTHRFPSLRVEVNDDCIFTGRGFVVLGLIRTYSAGLRILKYATYDDGSLDVCIFPCGSRREILAHAARAYCRMHIGRGGVIYCHARRVRISSQDDKVPVELDGESAGTLPIECTVLPTAATFLRWNGDTARAHA